MSIKTFMSYVCHPFFSILCMSFLCMATVLMLDDRNYSLQSFSVNDSILMLLYSALFMLYPILVTAFALPSLMMEYFQVKFWARTVCFIVLGLVCMFLNTILSDYGFLYVVIAISFSMVDYFVHKYQRRSAQ